MCAGFALLLIGPARAAIALRIVALTLGAMAGATAGSLATGAPAGIIAGAVCGAGGGVLFANGARRLFLQFAAAAVAGFIAVLCMLAFTDSRQFLPAIVIAAGLGALLAQIWMEDVATALVAFVGAQVIFHSVHVPADAWAVIWPEQVAERVIVAYLGALGPFAVASVLFIAWAIVERRVLLASARAGPSAPNAAGENSPEGAGPQMARWAVSARRIAVHLAAVIIGAAVATSVLWLAGVAEITRFQVTGLHALSWPAATAVTVPFIAWLGPVVSRANAVRGVAASRHIALMVFGVTALPVATVALLTPVSDALGLLGAFYAGFARGPAQTVLSKWVFSAGILPLLLARTLDTQ